MSWITEHATPDEILALKPRGFFRIAPAECGFALSIHRPGEPVQTFHCATPGSANRARMILSDAGLSGYIERAR